MRFRRFGIRLFFLRLILGIAFLSGVVFLPDAYAMQLPQFIRVRILQAQAHLFIDGFDLHVKGTNLNETNLPVHSMVRVSLSDRGWVIEPQSNNSGTHSSRELRFKGASVEISGEMIKFRGQMQPSAVFLLEKQGHGFDVVAKLPRDEYLKGVLPNEMPLKWPRAALAAQAVASLSYACAQAVARVNGGFDVDSSVESQVFRWDTFTHLTAPEKSKLAQVLWQTNNRVLVASNGKPYLAYFHSDCGGTTELPQNVWGEKHDFHAGGSAIVHDSYCLLNRHNHWHLHVTWAQIQSAVQARFHDFQGVIHDVNVLSRSPSGRAAQIEIDGGLKKLRISSQDFRQMMGYSRLRSTLFTIEHAPDGLVFDGRGFGHGVGLCQHGARFMALNGSTYRQILKHYYPYARLTSTPAVPVPQHQLLARWGRNARGDRSVVLDARVFQAPLSHRILNLRQLTASQFQKISLDERWPQ